jgi:hypothetical protein
MQKYLTILTNDEGSPDYFHPSELCGVSKQDIKNCMLENVPPESIVGIYTVNEYKTFIQSSSFKNAMVSEFEGRGIRKCRWLC